MKIAVLPGDGIGPEIVAEALRVLKAVEIKAEFEEAPVGGAGYRAKGHPLPEDTLKLVKSADAILFGAVGDFSLDTLPRELRPEQAILGLRRELNLFANFRPAIVYPELVHASSMKPEVVAGLDLLIIRELTGDIYFGQPRGIRTLENGEREGFDAARLRPVGRVGRRLLRLRADNLAPHAAHKSQTIAADATQRRLVQVGRAYPFARRGDDFSARDIAHRNRLPPSMLGEFEFA